MFYVLIQPKTKPAIDAVSTIGTLHTFFYRHRLLLSLNVLLIVCRQLWKRADLKLCLHVLTMAAYSLGGNTEAVSYLLRLASLGNQFHNLDFSLCELSIEFRLTYHALIPAFATERAAHLLEMKEAVRIHIGRMRIVFAKVASTKARYYVELVQTAVQLIDSV